LREGLLAECWIDVSVNPIDCLVEVYE
jgi:hypothetical protein